MKMLFSALLLAPSLSFAAGLPSEFESSRENQAGVVYLKAANVYKNLPAASRVVAVANAAASLGRTDGQMAVELDGDGELWRIKDGKAARLDVWSDSSLPLAHGAARTGRWFATFGMQGMSGGDYPSGTINLRLGTTLYRNRYDAAVSYDYYKLRDALEGRTSLGLVGRALIPLSAHGGWNIGGQLSSVDNYGKKSGSIGVVTGLNVYLPGGSFDLTLNLRDKGGYGLLAGYTIFLTR